MERIKQMSLKKALFTIAGINITAALILSLLSFWGCSVLGSHLATERIVMDVHSAPFLISHSIEPESQIVTASRIISIFQLLLPTLIYIAALFLAASTFYRLKLKRPLEVLEKGAARIIDNDLDFSIEATSPDELGALCTAFETMRRTLLNNNRELWRQTEERKRLNAAFSHNLRNPVTVLKGSAKLARKAITDNPPGTDQIAEHLALIESYAGRIEHYIETMSGIQKLEETPVEREPVQWDTLMTEFEHMVQMMSLDSDKHISFCTPDYPDTVRTIARSVLPGKSTPPDRPISLDNSIPPGKTILLDKSILFQIAENLISNALRFARQDITVTCSINNTLNETLTETFLELSVTDDGRGFPAALVGNGIRPFQKGNEDAGHFGMGLYTCKLLCERHGGGITIMNQPTGASASALLQI